MADREPTLVDRGLDWAKNNPYVSVLILLGVAVIGVGSVAAAIGDNPHTNYELRKWVHSTGYFVEVKPLQWEEWKHGKKIASYTTREETGEYVYLYDEGRNLMARLSKTDESWRQGQEGDFHHHADGHWEVSDGIMPTLVDRGLDWAKNNPYVSVLILLGVAVIGVGSVAAAIGHIRKLFSGPPTKRE